MERSSRVEAPSRKIWPGMDQMISDYDKLERNLRDLRNVLAVIAFNQDDNCLTVPMSALQAIPAGCELEVSFDRALDQYNFKCIVPSDNAAGTEGAGLATDDHVAGVLG